MEYMKTEYTFEIPKKDYSSQIVWLVTDILSNEFIVTISRKATNYILQVKPKFDKLISKDELKDLLQDHLNSQVIRSRLVKETGKLREMIVSLALYSTQAFDDESSTFDISSFPDDDNYLLDKRDISKTFEKI